MDEKAFTLIPMARVDIEDCRQFAQELYEYYPRVGRLRSQDFDRAAAEKGAHCLGQTA